MREKTTSKTNYSIIHFLDSIDLPTRSMRGNTTSKTNSI